MLETRMRENKTGRTMKNLLSIALIFSSGLPLGLLLVAPVFSAQGGTIYFEPESYVFRTDEIGVGGRFNTTVRVKGVTDMFAWQVKVYFNNTLLNCTNIWYAPDEPITKGAHMPVPPSIENERGYVLYGITSLAIPPAGVDVPEDAPKGLCIIEFEVIKAPPKMGYAESDLAFDEKGLTKWEDSVGDRYVPPELSLYDGYYKYISMPEIKVFSPLNKTYTTRDVLLNLTVDRDTSWVKYSLDGEENVTVTEDAEANATITTTLTVYDGSHWIVFYANDTAGVTGSSRMVYFTVDATPPIISILSPENTTYVARDVPLSFTVSEPTSWMGYSLDGEANVTITANTTLTDLSEGSHWIIVYANDTVGNMESSVGVYFTWIFSAHDVAVCGIDPSSTRVDSGQQIDIIVHVRNEGTESETFNVTMCYNTTVIETQTVTDLNPENTITLAFIWNTATVTQGNYTIKATASSLPNETDIEDNTCIYPRKIEVTLPSVPPVAIFTYSPETVFVNETVHFNAALSTPNAGSIISYEWNFGDDNITTTIDPIVSHVYRGKGEHEVTLTVENTAGCTDTCTSSVYVQDLAPPSWVVVAAIEIGIVMIGITAAVIIYFIERARKS